MVATSLLSILLALLIINLTWDRRRGVWKDPTVMEETIKAIMSLNTVVLIWQLYDYYKYQERHELRTWMIPDSIEWNKSKWR